MKKALITIPFSDKEKYHIRTLLHQYDVFFKHYKEVEKKDLQNTKILIGNISPQLLKDNELEWIQTYSAGVEHYTNSDYFCPETLLTNCSGAFGHAIAEHMLTMLLMLIKNFHAHMHHQMQSTWKKSGEVRSLSSLRTLVIGTGNIGTEFAWRMNALGAQVSGMRRRTQLSSPIYHEMIHPKHLSEKIASFDVVALCLPKTNNTNHIINRQVFHLMKPGTYILNVGRGNAIDQIALIDALKNNIIAGAGLDVFEEEPLPSTSELWNMKNVIITPHCSGAVNMKETKEAVQSIVIQNIEKYTKGESLINQFDPQKNITFHQPK